MKEWIVYRHGYNAANNSARNGGPEAVPVARVEAETEDEAARLAAKRVTVYNNQHLYAEPAEEVDAEEAETDRRVRPITPEEARELERKKVADPKYTPTVEEALRHPDAFVDGMEEIR